MRLRTDILAVYTVRLLLCDAATIQASIRSRSCDSGAVECGSRRMLESWGIGRGYSMHTDACQDGYCKVTQRNR
jgi:hypothetical protein